MILLVQRDLPYLPIPNRVEIIGCSMETPLSLTSTSFLIAFREHDQACLMAMNRRRGLEFSGGHVEPGETAEQAALREGLEEVGVLVDHPRPLGYLKMISQGPRPPEYRYPYPLSYQRFFTGLITQQIPYEANDECLEPVWILPHEAEDRLGEGQLAMYRHAHRTLFSGSSG